MLEVWLWRPNPVVELSQWQRGAAFDSRSFSAKAADCGTEPAAEKACHAAALASGPLESG